MEPLTKRHFDALRRYLGWPCVSVYLPTHPGGFEGQAGRIHLKNLLAEAERRLVARGTRPVEARDFLTPANDLVDDDRFWKDQTAGLAVLTSPQATQSFYLPIKVHPLAVVNSRFHIAPLVPLFDQAAEFYVLAVSENGVRLLKADRWYSEEVVVPGLPVNAEEALHYDHPTNTRQFHTAVLGRHMSKLGAYHGGGDFFEQEKNELLEYFRIIDRALHPVLRDEHLPLVFAGVDYLFPIFREANTYPHLADAHVHGNTETWSDEQLHERAWSSIGPHFAKPRQAALARYATLGDDGFRSDDLRVILAAAEQGKVETLFASVEEPVWGKWDSTHRRLRLDAERGDHSDDMIDLAIAETLAHRGTVYSVPSASFSAGKHCQAIFRYELPPSSR